jgi:hypothetical protein
MQHLALWPHQHLRSYVSGTGDGVEKQNAARTAIAASASIEYAAAAATAKQTADTPARSLDTTLATAAATAAARPEVSERGE